MLLTYLCLEILLLKDIRSYFYHKKTDSFTEFDALAFCILSGLHFVACLNAIIFLFTGLLEFLQHII
jgi:hypothetical protein